MADRVAQVARDIMTGLAVAFSRGWGAVRDAARALGIGWAFTAAGAPARWVAAPVVRRVLLHQIERDEELIRLMSAHPSLAAASLSLHASVAARRRALLGLRP